MLKKPNKQKGHAGILFALLAPVLVLIFSYAFNTVEAWQRKTRGGDVAEANVVSKAKLFQIDGITDNTKSSSKSKSDLIDNKKTNLTDKKTNLELYHLAYAISSPPIDLSKNFGSNEAYNNSNENKRRQFVTGFANDYKPTFIAFFQDKNYKIDTQAMALHVVDEDSDTIRLVVRDESSHAQVGRYAAQVIRLEHENEELKKKIKELEDQGKDAKKFKARLTQVESDLKTVKEKLAKVEDKLEKTEKKLEKTEDKLEKTEDKLEKTEDKLEKTEDKLKESEIARMASEENTKEAKKETAEERTKRIAAEKENRQLQQEKEIKEKIINGVSLHKDKEKLLNYLKTVKPQIDQKKRDQLQDFIDELSNTTKDLSAIKLDIVIFLNSLL